LNIIKLILLSEQRRRVLDILSAWRVEFSKPARLMASSTGLTVAGALLAGDFRLPAVSSLIPRKTSSSLSCLSNRDLSSPYNCCWRLSRGKILTSLSNSRKFAVGKEAEDGFLSVRSNSYRFDFALQFLQ